jgi:hypothetical protein
MVKWPEPESDHKPLYNVENNESIHECTENLNGRFGALVPWVVSRAATYKQRRQIKVNIQKLCMLSCNMYECCMILTFNIISLNSISFTIGMEFVFCEIGNEYTLYSEDKFQMQVG